MTSRHSWNGPHLLWVRPLAPANPPSRACTSLSIALESPRPVPLGECESAGALTGLERARGGRPPPVRARMRGSDPPPRSCAGGTDPWPGAAPAGGAGFSCKIGTSSCDIGCPSGSLYRVTVPHGRPDGQSPGVCMQHALADITGCQSIRYTAARYVPPALPTAARPGIIHRAGPRAVWPSATCRAPSV